MLPPPQLTPARDLAEARRRIGAMQQLDGPEILPQAHTTLLDRGRRTDLAVVLMHGFTNHPGQYREFAPLAFERGANVLIPRFPEHGDRNRLTRRLKKMTAQMLIDTANEAIGAAFGLGERVRIMGISSSALLCVYFAQRCAQLDRAIAVSPEFAILDFSRGATRAAELALRALPNMFLWWDPRVKNGMHPLTAYPRFSTRALAETLRIADDVYACSKRQPFAAGGIDVVVNACDPAVNNAVTKQTVEQWNERRDGATYFEFGSLPSNHDIIEPDNPKANTAAVYPKLLELLFAES